MKKHLFKVSLLMVFVSIGLMVPHSSAIANSPVWITLGIGPGGVTNGGSGQSWIGSQLAASWCNSAGMWTVRFSSCTEFVLLGSADPLETVGDLGVLYGKRWSQPGLGFMSLSGGVALVHGVRRGEFIRSSGGWFGTSHYEEESFVTVGLPVDVQFALAAFQGIGLAADFFGNLNSERTYGGASVSLIIGKLW
jgi:hypothetical protein